MKINLQINLNYGDNLISACGIIKGNLTAFVASNFSELLKQVKKLQIKVTDITLTFQPEE